VVLDEISWRGDFARWNRHTPKKIRKRLMLLKQNFKAQNRTRTALTDRKSTVNMKITAVAPFQKYEDEIQRVAEELISRLCEAKGVKSVSFITRENNAFISPSTSRNKKVPFFTACSFVLPRILLKIIELYRGSDVFRFSLPEIVGETDFLVDPPYVDAVASARALCSTPN